MKDGFYKMTDYEYFSIDALSNSKLKRFDISPAHAFTDIEKTGAMKYGTLGHAFLLDPEEFAKYILAPPECLNKTEKPYPKFKKDHPDNKIMLHKELNDLKAIKNNLLEYDMEPGVKFGDFYPKCEKELTGIYFDTDIIGDLELKKENLDQFIFKIKLDFIYFNNETPLIFDPKFTGNALKLGSNIGSEEFKYYRQAGFYCYVVEKLTGLKPIFYYIGIEKKPPYGIYFHEVPEKLLKAGLQETFLSVQKYINWVKAGSIIRPTWGGIKTAKIPYRFKYL